NQQLRRRADHKIRSRNLQSRKSGGQTERAVIEHALPALAVGKWEQPRTHHADAAHSFVKYQPAERSAIILGNSSRGMIRKSGKHGDLVSCTNPVVGKLRGACCRRAHLRWKIL